MHLQTIYDGTADETCGPQAVAKCAREFVLEFQMRSHEIEKWNVIGDLLFFHRLKEAQNPGRVSCDNRVRLEHPL